MLPGSANPTVTSTQRVTRRFSQWMSKAIIALCVLGASSLAAADGVHATAPSTSPPRFGVMTDVGLPDGATASLVYRPVRPLRIAAGASYNMISTGVRAGITYVPFASWFTPTLGLAYGHYRDGDANPFARLVTGDKTISEASLSRVGYDYADAQLGLEFGRTWFTFYIHAGMSRIAGTVHDLDTTIAHQTMASSTSSTTSTTVTFAKDPNVTLWAPSASLGFVVYLGR